MSAYKNNFQYATLIPVNAKRCGLSYTKILATLFDESNNGNALIKVISGNNQAEHGESILTEILKKGKSAYSSLVQYSFSTHDLFRRQRHRFEKVSILKLMKLDKNYTSPHLRVSGKPKSLHEEIYKKLGVPRLKNQQLTYLAHRL